MSEHVEGWPVSNGSEHFCGRIAHQLRALLAKDGTR